MFLPDQLGKDADLSKKGLMQSFNAALALRALGWCIPDAECADLCCYCLCECLEIGFCSPYLVDEGLYAVGCVVKHVMFVRKHRFHSQSRFEVTYHQDGHCLLVLKSFKIGEIDLDDGLPVGLLLMWCALSSSLSADGAPTAVWKMCQVVFLYLLW